VEIELVVQATQDGAVQNVRCPLERLVVIGRDPESPVQVQGPGISREHLGIEDNAGRILLHDLSSNGTWVNGARLEKGRPREIHEGDRIEIPGYQIDFRLPQPPVPEPPPDTQAAPAHVPAATQELPAAPAKKSFMAPVTGMLGSLSALEKLMILAAIASFSLGIYYYTS